MILSRDIDLNLMVTKVNARVLTETIWLKVQWLAGVKVLNFRPQNIFFYLMG